jgi:hypothetical protein
MNPTMPGGGGDLPCGVDTVLVSRCQTCHDATPRYGAPMPLVTWADTQAPAKSDPTKKVYEMIGIRVRDAARPMPPTADLAAADQTTLTMWTDAGAPQGMACGTGMTPMLPPAPKVGPDTLPCTPTQTFRAHGTDSPTSLFNVPVTAANLYECFTFKSPFNGTEQAIAWAPIIDDQRVLHHWILYRTHTAQPDGAAGPCNMPSDATFLAGWAPGGGNWIMPSDVSLELPSPTDSLILQVHYHNAAGYPDANDSSGVALCTTDTPREHTAGFYTLGSVNIDLPAMSTGVEVTGNCPGWLTHYLPQPITILASFPHMHTHGVAFRTDILRGGDSGPVDPLVEVPHFDFESQTAYPRDPPMLLNPGDSIRTTCTYDNPTATEVRFGERTEDEMCFNFIMIYPISLFQTSNRSCGLL